MSTKSPAESNMPSTSASVRPLSMTCVSPRSRGFDGRIGRPRNSSTISKPFVDGFLEPLARLDLDVLVERLAVGVHPDDQRPEVPHAEQPQALGHQVLPLDPLDLLDLRRLERRGAADDRQVDAAVLAQRLE